MLPTNYIDYAILDLHHGQMPIEVLSCFCQCQVLICKTLNPEHINFLSEHMLKLYADLKMLHCPYKQ